MEPLSNLPSDALDGFLRPDANEYLVLIASIRATNDFSGRSMIGCRSLSRQFTTTAGFSPLDSGPRDLLVPFTSEPMVMWPISTRVNKPENDYASILERVDEPLDSSAKGRW